MNGEKPAVRSEPPEHATPEVIRELVTAVRGQLDATEDQQETLEELGAQMAGTHKAVAEGFRDFERRFADLEAKVTAAADAASATRTTVEQLGELLAEAIKRDERAHERLERRLDETDETLGQFAAELSKLTPRGAPNGANGANGHGRSPGNTS